MAKDKRYTIALEYTGAFEDYVKGKSGYRYVVRFCGSFVGSYSTKSKALECRNRHAENIIRFARYVNV